MPSLSAANVAQVATPGGGPALPHVQSMSAAGQDQSGPLSVTSHSLSLCTRAFSVDFSWSRVETQEPASRGPAQAPAAAPASHAQPAPARTQRPLQSFQEILRRQQLAQLLVVVPPTPRDAVLLWGADPPAVALPRPVCRAYSQAQGPLAQSSLLYSA
ncbi:MAG: hypothetical protein HY794_08685 [Desulfarculus sp.]|nr:hypothetical protein [Desulfarculus sp.]